MFLRVPPVLVAPPLILALIYFMRGTTTFADTVEYSSWRASLASSAGARGVDSRENLTSRWLLRSLGLAVTALAGLSSRRQSRATRVPCRSAHVGRVATSQGPIARNLGLVPFREDDS